jgi:hypothetical protein
LQWLRLRFRRTIGITTIIIITTYDVKGMMERDTLL